MDDDRLSQQLACQGNNMYSSNTSDELCRRVRQCVGNGVFVVHVRDECESGRRAPSQPQRASASRAITKTPDQHHLRHVCISLLLSLKPLLLLQITTGLNALPQNLGLRDANDKRPC